MGLLELIVVGVGLAMDAFAISVCKGLSMRKMSVKSGCIVGGYFGGGCRRDLRRERCR